ncbi:MAG: histidine ammonia-lyase [Rhizobiaceae bacterium]|nr:histidine ammonia-lyase [Rhizobiaceae bacterium]
MTPLVVGGAALGVDDVVAVARDGRPVELAEGVIDRLSRSRIVLDAVAASGQRIYGLNTGLGANLGTSVTGDAAAFQRQLIEGRSGGIGPPLSRDAVRAVMLARIAMLARGGSGITPLIVETLVAALNSGIYPVMPSLGSIGAGDLQLLTPVARMLIGEGEVEFRGEARPAGEAFAMAGLMPVKLNAKDGLSLVGASAVSVGCAALALADARAVFVRQQEAAALTFETIGANRSILDTRLQAARPAVGQEDAAAQLRALLARPDPPSPAAIQDPLSVRCLPSIHGALLHAIGAAEQAVVIELNAAADNPLVLAGDGCVLSTGNFHTAALSLAFETLGLSIAQAAAATAARFVQLTGSSRHGLPRYLSPIGGASAGFVPLQKTAAALLAAIRHAANPAMLDFLPVSEGVEDHAAQTPLAVAKCSGMLDHWRRLVALEFLAAAQAADLRGDRLGPTTGRLRDAVRLVAPPLGGDRPLGADVEALYAALSNGKWQA